MAAFCNFNQGVPHPIPRQEMVIASEAFGRDSIETVYAHNPERCFVKYSADGKYLYSAGSEGKVYVYPLDKPLASESVIGHRIHKGAIWDLAVRPGLVATASSDCSAVIYGADPEGLAEGAKMVFRSALGLKCVSVSPDGKKLACAGDKHEVTLVDLERVEEPPKQADEHTRPVVCIEFDPLGEYIAAIDLAGDLVIFTSALVRVDKIKVPLKEGVFPKLAWRPDGAMLAVSSSDTIRLIQRGSGWTTAKHINTADAHRETARIFWAASNLLVSHDMSTIAMWSLESTGKPWNTISSEKSFLALAISPDGLEAAFIDHEGNLVRQRNFMSRSDLEGLKKNTLADAAPVKKAKEAGKKKARSEIDSIHKKYLDRCKDDDDDDDEENDELDDSMDEGSEVDLDNTSGGDSGEDDLGMDLDDYSVEGDHEEEAQEAEPVPEPSVSVYKPVVHPNFQPGATDPKADHRYMAWNMVGIVTSRLDEAGYRSVDIDFHDKLGTRPIRFIDDFGYTMAALSKAGAVFATEGDDTANGVLHYMAFETWHGRQTWTCHLEQGEKCLGLACDDRFAYIATSNGWLRIFSATGLQLPILTYGYDFVCMTAGAGKLLTVLSNNGHLLAQVYSTASGTPILTAEAPLGRRADKNRLAWIGISEGGLVGAFDQTGILYCLCDKLGFCWSPIGDFTGNDGLVWPVFFDSAEVTAIVCKSGESGPTVLPRPIMTSLPINLPLLQADDQVTQLYEPVLKTAILDGRLMDGTSGMRDKDRRRLHTASDKHCLELIQLSLKADKPLRALDLCRMFYHEKSFDIAVQLARHHRLLQLADKVDELKDEFLARSTALAPAVLETTPRLPVRIQKESPSVILANLTPGEKPDLRASESTLVDSPSAALRLQKRTRMDLVADANEVSMEPEQPPFHLHEDGLMEPEYPHHEPHPQSEVITTISHPTEKKPKGLADMLAKLSSLSTEPAAPTATAPKKAGSPAPQAKENVPELAAKSLKQASLPFPKKTVTPAALVEPASQDTQACEDAATATD